MPLFPAPTPTGQFLYLPTGWDAAWKAAKATIGSQRVNVVGIGDSVIAGQNSTDIMINSAWAVLRSKLLAANNNALGGDHYSLLYSAKYGLGTATPPVVINGTQGTDYAPYYCGFTYGSFAGATTLTPAVTCTPPYSVVGFDILYIDFAAGSWTYNVDGGSNTTVTTTGPGTAAGAIVKKVSITGLTAGAHTLNINTNASGANTCCILGINVYAASSGLCFANMGWFGMGLVTGQNTNNALSDTGKFPPDRLALYQGYQGTTAAPTSLTGLGFPAQPDLAIIEFGINDANQSVARGTFRDALDRLVWTLRYGKNDACSIMIVAAYTADGTIASSISVANQDYTAGQITAYRDLCAAMYEVAQVQGCAYVDVHGSFGRKPVTNGWVTSVSDIHPTVTGYAKMANLVSSIL